MIDPSRPRKRLAAGGQGITPSSEKHREDDDTTIIARRHILGMLAADRVPFIGYHMPCPGIGLVEARGDGFRYVPASYQMMLG